MALVIESLQRPIVINNIPFTIEEERVLRELRISKISSLKEMPEQNIARYIKKAIDTGYGLIEPKAIYRTYRLIQEEGKPPAVEGWPGLFFGKKVVEMLFPCHYVTLLLTTIGPKLPAMSDAIIKTEPTDGFYLEYVGGWMADYMADRVEERVQAECAKMGYSLTFRYAPGYGDWTLDAQPMIMKMLESEKIGVRLNEANIMIPRKSVSAALGWIPKKE